jgi:anti-sigma factor RsiW
MSPNDPFPSVSDHDLHAFVDGALDGRRYRRIVAHLATDPMAAERVNGFLRQQGELSQLRDQLGDFVDPLSDEATSDLTRQLAGAVRHQRKVRWGAAASGMAAMVLVGVVSLWGPDPSKVAARLSMQQQIVDAGPQVLFGRDPLKGAAQLAASESGTAPPELEQQLAAYAVRRPDLAVHGLRFVGGDALKGGEAPPIRLIYEDSEHRRVFLFVGAVGSDADVALTLVPEGHVSLNWRRGNLVFALIGPKESEQLLDVMAATGELLAPGVGIGSDTVTAGNDPVVSGVVAGEVAAKASDAPATESIATTGSAHDLVAPSSKPLPITPVGGVTENTPKPL